MAKRKRKTKRTSAGSPHWRLCSFELHGEAIDPHSAPVSECQYEAVEALRRGDGRTAEKSLARALAIEPDAPDLLNNLAAAYELQGRREESSDLVRQIHQRNPNYLFGRTNLAHLCIRSGQLEEARNLVAPLLSRRRFHFSEFAAMCAAQIHMALAEGNVDGARSWFQMWSEVDPDHPGLAQWRPSVFGFRSVVRRALARLARRA